MATVDDAREGKAIADILDKYTYKNGRDIVTTWNDWLSWCCKVFEWRDIERAGGIPQRFIECKEENPLFFDAMEGWLALAYEKICKRGAYDAFGALYEANYQSSFKANSCGQFFTPTSVCDALARIGGNGKCLEPTEEIVSFNDCACGSGRTLLSAWNECDKYNRNLFFAGDLDATSVYMCALNFMVHGMVGAVEKRDALTREWYFGFIVNACKVPYANNFACLQSYDNEEEYKKAVNGLIANAKVWNCIDYRPKSEQETIREEPQREEEPKAETPIRGAEPIENKQIEQKSVKEPIQLSLFD